MYVRIRFNGKASFAYACDDSVNALTLYIAVCQVSSVGGRGDSGSTTYSDWQARMSTVPAGRDTQGNTSCP